MDAGIRNGIHFFTILLLSAKQYNNKNHALHDFFLRLSNSLRIHK